MRGSLVAPWRVVFLLWILNLYAVDQGLCGPWGSEIRLLR